MNCVVDCLEYSSSIGIYTKAGKLREAIGAKWFTICLIGLIGIGYNVQAYLLEVSLGLTIFLAYAVSIFLSDIS